MSVDRWDGPAAFVELVDAANQELVIEAAGDDVRWIDGNTPPDADPDAIMPDWIRLVARAVNLGMMSGAEVLPGTSRATVTGVVFDAAAAQWQVTLAHTDPGVLRVMLTLLRARQLTAFGMRTMRAPLGAARIDAERLAYPTLAGHVPFAVEREPPVRATRDRLLEIVFEQPPDDARQASAMAALDIWGDLLILGAYASPDRDPWRAHTLPDFPYWLDDVTLVQPFAEAFESDEACFDAMVNWAARAHLTGTPVRAVRVH